MHSGLARNLSAVLASKEEKMRRFRESNWIISKILLVITLPVLCSALSCQKQDAEADIAAIKEMGKQYAVACNTGDFDLWISLWADDGVQMPPGAPARVGKEQIRQGMKPLFDQMDLEITIHSLEDTEVYGNLGLTRCRYTLRMTPKAGGDTIKAMPDGKALTLYEKQSDGSWKIIYDCFNSNVPPTVE